MKKSLILAAAAIAALSACTKEIEVTPINDANVPVLTATIEDCATKTQLTTGSTESKKKVEWLNTDKVFIFGYDTPTISSFNAAFIGNFNVEPGSDASKATLRAGSLQYNAPSVTATSFLAFYPASISILYSKTSEEVASSISQLGAEYYYDNYGKVIRLPQEQKYNGNDISQIAPMVARTSNNTLQFKNLTSLLAITVNADDFTSVSSITLSTSNEAKYSMAGNYYLALGTDLGWGLPTGYGSEYFNTVTLDCKDSNGVNTAIPEGGSKTFYVSIPPKTYPYIKICVTDGASTTKTMKTKASSITVDRNKIYPITFVENMGGPNLFPGEFSVSATKKVHFTKGNLYWNGSNYKFEPNQTDYQTSWNANHVSHFYWTTDASSSYSKFPNKGGQSTTDVPYFAESQGGLTVEGISGLFVLSAGEWDYLLGRRNRNNLSLVQCGVSVTNNGATCNNCMIIAPDDFYGILQGSYTLAELNALGLVCLPPAGVRVLNIFSACGGEGYYFSSNSSQNTTQDEDNNTVYLSYCAYFNSETVLISEKNRSARSLRLVTLVQ